MTRQPIRITIAGTGGTIAASGATQSETVEYRVTTSVADLIAGLAAHVPEVAVESAQIVNVDSSEIDPALLLTIARGAADILARPEVDALVLTHGTDSLEETAYFLQLVLKTAKPVVIVGAMRPATALGADGPANLVDALRVAAAPASRGMGVLVVSNGSIYSGRDITKTHTTALDALGAARIGALGEISGTEVVYRHRPVQRHTETSAFDIRTIHSLPTVDIIYDHQGARDLLYRAVIAEGAQGVVVAAYGNGSMSPAAIQGLDWAAEAGIPFVRASRTGGGVVSRRQGDLEAGSVSALGLNPQKARILLITALASGVARDALQEIFATH